MKKRSQIPEKYKWDLSTHIKDENEIKRILSIMEKLPDKLAKYNGKLNDKELLIERFNKFTKDFSEIDKLASYISNSLNVDSENIEMIKLSQRFNTLAQKIDLADAFFEPQMYELDDKYLNELLNEKRLKNWDNYIRDIIKFKPHKLDEQSSLLLSKMSKFTSPEAGLHSDMLDELKYADIVDENGKKYKLDNSNISKFLQGKNRTLRKNAYISRLKAYKQFNKTFADIYINELEKCKFYAEIHKYKSRLESVLLSSEIPESILENNIKIVTKNIKILQNFVKIQKKLSNLKDFSFYDLLEDSGLNKKFTIEQSQKIILEALKPLGEEYLSIVKRKFADRSIDYLPCEHKETGGYCSNTYNTKTVILMNFVDDFDSLSTLIHEMGHCVNAEYFNANQPYQKAGITIFSAEIASTVNEILLNFYMQNNAKTKREKSYYLKQFLDGVNNTIFRQTLFTEFELFAHTKIENDENLTYKDLNNEYLRLSKKYYGASIIPSVQQYEWMRIPHFYSSYYVYTYSTGMLTAITIANKLLTDASFKDKYIKFLKNGVNKPAVEMLKEIGIDVTNLTTFESAFNFISKQLKTYADINK